MTSEDKESNPAPTTAIVSSFAEAIVAVGKLTFPVLAIPFGAEAYGTPAWLFQTGSEVTQEALDILLLESIPMAGLFHFYAVNARIRKS